MTIVATLPALHDLGAVELAAPWDTMPPLVCDDCHHDTDGHRETGCQADGCDCAVPFGGLVLAVPEPTEAELEKARADLNTAPGVYGWTDRRDWAAADMSIALELVLEEGAASPELARRVRGALALHAAAQERPW